MAGFGGEDRRQQPQDLWHVPFAQERDMLPKIGRWSFAAWAIATMLAVIGAGFVAMGVLP